MNARYTEVAVTIGSKKIIRNGRVSVTVKICLSSFFSCSTGPNIWLFPVDFRRALARLSSKTGPKVSGRARRGIKVAPAKIRPIQKDHRHPMEVDTNPDIAGAAAGPTQVV